MQLRTVLDPHKPGETVNYRYSLGRSQPPCETTGETDAQVFGQGHLQVWKHGRERKGVGRQAKSFLTALAPAADAEEAAAEAAPVIHP